MTIVRRSIRRHAAVTRLDCDISRITLAHTTSMVDDFVERVFRFLFGAADLGTLKVNTRNAPIRCTIRRMADPAPYGPASTQQDVSP